MNTDQTTLSAETLAAPAEPLSMHGLYAQHSRWLVTLLSRRLRSRHDAQDLAHDTFSRILAGREVSAIKEPRAYLLTVARGLLVSWYRRQSLERAYLEALAQLPEPMAPSPEHYHIVLETLAELDAALAELPRPVRRAFLLAQIEGMKYQAIADKLGVSLITVKRHVRKALVHCMQVMA